MGEHYIIEKNGKPVAQMAPVKTANRDGTLKELKFLLKKLPPLDDELVAFAEDLEAVNKYQPPLPVEEDIWAQLRKKGIQIGAHDLMIGSTALALGFSVATFNKRHFERIEGLKIETLHLDLVYFMY